MPAELRWACLREGRGGKEAARPKGQCKESIKGPCNQLIMKTSLMNSHLMDYVVNFADTFLSADYSTLLR